MIRRGVIVATLATCLLAAPAMAKERWTKRAPTGDGAYWRADLGSVVTQGKLDPDGPFLQVRVEISERSRIGIPIPSQLLIFYFRCETEQGKVAAQTDMIRGQFVPRLISSDKPFLRVPPNGEIRDVYNLICRPLA